jgi:hypothetical protein
VYAGCQRAKGRADAGPDECSLAERVGTHGDAANGFARETLLASIGLDGDLIAREADQASRGDGPGPVLDMKPIVEVGSKSEILERVQDLSGALRPCQ